MTFFRFPKVKWLQYTGEVSIQVRLANIQAIGVKFSQDLTDQKSLKFVNIFI